MKVTLASFGVIAVCLVAVSAQAAMIWDVENDFSSTVNNDTSTWSYRQGSRDANTALPMWDSAVLAGSWSPGPDVGGWVTADDYTLDPYVLHNSTGVAQTLQNSVHAPINAVIYGPTECKPNENAIISWKSPITGLVSISAKFIRQQNGGDGVNYYIDLNGSAGNLLNGSVGAGSGATSGALTIDNLPVTVGDRINFVLDNRLVAQCDTTQLRATINEVPEPMSMVMLACGIAGLLAYAWRKRK
jgi:hypothetical protein